MVISFTGSQSGMTLFQKEQLEKHLKELGCSELVNGMCIGSDEEATLIAMRSGIKNYTFHPSNLGSTRSKALMLPFVQENYQWGQWIDIANGCIGRCFPEVAPMDAGRTIVDSSKYLIVTPKEFSFTIRSKTWHIVKYAWKKQKIGWQVIVIPPIVRD